MVIIADQQSRMSKSASVMWGGEPRAVRVGEAVCINPFGVGVLRRDGECWAWDDTNGYWYGPTPLLTGTKPYAKKKAVR